MNVKMLCGVKCNMAAGWRHYLIDSESYVQLTGCRGQMTPGPVWALCGSRHESSVPHIELG